MEETPAIACTLTELELRDRYSAWMKVGRYATSGDPVPGGLRFRFPLAPGVGESLEKLVALERECCAWMTITLEPMPAGLVMTVTGIGEDGQEAARETFAPLADLVSGRPSPTRP